MNDVIENDDDDDDENTGEILPFVDEQQGLEDEELEALANGQFNEEESTASSHEGLFQRNAPLYELNAYYGANHGVSNVSNRINARSCPRQSDFDRSSEPWTAVFECPISSIKYPAGSLRNDPCPSIPLKTDEGIIICYKKKSKAKHAAAARALDAIQYQVLGIKEPRLCEEDPSESGAPLVPTATEQSHDETASEPIVASEVHLESNHLLDLVPHDKCLDDVAIASGDVGDGSAEEELVIAHIPLPSRQHPPYRKVLEAVACGNAHASSLTSMENERVPLPMNPLLRLKLAIYLANSWSRAQRDRNRRPSSPNITILKSNPSSALNLTIGKAVLASLAEANQSVGITANTYRVEEAASRVLSLLLQHADTSDNARSLEPNVFGNFLFCMEDRSPLTVAQKAEDFVKNMKEGGSWNGFALPKPDTEVFNALIQIHAQVGGTSGRYERLESDFVPSKESFMSLLSSQIYRPVHANEVKGFDADFCHKCIKRMYELAIATQNEALRPDVKVYNAPLRWYGGSQFRKSRPYARALPPDNFDRLFALGFLEYELPSTTYAKSIEAWMESMKMNPDSRVSPDIETYEAVIQAWVRSGTRSGLDRAQEIATSLLESGATPQPRLQTFRPIIIAWVMSIDPDGPTKIQQLIDRLEAAGKLLPELRPDARMYQYLITSHVYTQGLRLETEPSAAVTLESIRQSAVICDQIISQLCATLPADSHSCDTFVEITPFEHTVLAWRNAALAAIATSQPSDIAAESPKALGSALEGMMGAVQRFEDCLKELRDIENRRQLLGTDESQRLTLQLKHLIRVSHRVYSALTVGLRDIHSKARKLGISVSSSIVAEYYTRIESAVRRSVECDLVATHDSNLQVHRKLSKLSRPKPGSDNKPKSLAQAELPHGHHLYLNRLTYSDHLAVGYAQRKKLLTGWTHDAFVQHVVEFLQAITSKGKSPIPQGDVLRLVMLLRDYCSRTDGYGKQDESRDAIHQLLNQLLPFSRDHRHPRRHAAGRGGKALARRVPAQTRPNAATARRSRPSDLQRSTVS